MASFANLQEVQLFEWQFQDYLNYYLQQHVMASQAGIQRAFLASAQLTDGLFAILRPWTSQVLAFSSSAWQQVEKRIPAPVINALKKLDDLRDSVWSAGLDVIGNVAASTSNLVSVVVQPIGNALNRIRIALGSLQGIAQGIAYVTDAKMFEADVRTHESSGATADQVDRLSSYLDHILDVDNLLQPRLIFRTFAEYAGGFVAILVNGGIHEDPTPQFEEDLEKYPGSDPTETLVDLSKGIMLSEERVKEALESFNRIAL